MHRRAAAGGGRGAGAGGVGGAAGWVMGGMAGGMEGDGGFVYPAGMVQVCVCVGLCLFLSMVLDILFVVTLTCRQIVAII